jgi:WhiB family redox-sensing transcriptional regulator
MIEPDLVRLSSPEALRFPLTDWMSGAKCEAGEWGHIWDYDTGADGSDRAAKHAKAIAICQTCPVLALCDTYAEQNDLVGVWGGKCRGDNLALGSRVACGSCHRDAQLDRSATLANRRRERNAAAERARYAAMSPEEKAARRARRYATPELREAAKQRHIKWKANRTAERKAADNRADTDRTRRRRALEAAS